ncbi:L-lactate dehydrogenase (cytochrome) [Nocardia transvalensis]|uniref:L-lactate dehydrogenase (Cytochrome) n=1 Tax=Nocardia transvalensis TaxID=37333 RepID=A0A7W9PMF3_9NOCA|nr:pre-mycofactocin synthase MftD [Nocardia transvalensis]MBB5918344.1 L-lactate dehydrogenase (cytochrome) [Nocardia transvalensis]
MASTKDWFESVAEAQRRAKKRVPKSVYLALLAGSEAGVTLDDNAAAFTELGFRPHIADLPATRDLSTTVLGQEISFPVICSPTGVQAVDPEGEVGVARGAAQSGTAIGLSSFGSKPVEEVVAANDKTFFQVYWLGDKDAMTARLDRARAAGAKGIIVTLDWVFASARDWGSPALPERIDVRTAMSFAPQVLARPGWLWRFARSGHLPDLTTPNLVPRGQQGPTFFGAYGEWMGTPPPTWNDLAWLRQQWDGPFLIKGIGRPDDAKRAVDIGATAISVSNHGGNNLDSTPATIRLLPGIADAVGDQLEILLDGGIRRGGDVVKALALGARAVMIGRPYLWGMAAAGGHGVHNVLEVLRQGIDSTLYGLGHSSIHEVTRDDIVIPDGFTRGL